MAPALRADEIIGAEVRTSDDKIVGEVRNIIFGTKDRRDYIIVASGGFFVPGKDSIVVPIRSLQVSEDRASFYLLVTEAQVKNVPLMPDPDYHWLSDEAWRARNDALFAGVAKPSQSRAVLLLQRSRAVGPLGRWFWGDLSSGRRRGGVCDSNFPAIRRQGLRVASCPSKFGVRLNGAITKLDGAGDRVMNRE
jgi:hypothetical protein